MSKLHLVLCSSAQFYPNIIALSTKLEGMGIHAILPKTAATMKAEGRENEEVKTDWLKTPAGPHQKSLFIRGHFEKIAKGDAILVANYEKHGKANYIGPNVLMEMAVAFSLKKPIYILYGLPEDSPFVDEILGLEPIFLHGDIKAIKS